MRIDLHSHSSVSDGTDSPAAVVEHAAAAGLDVLALTDHDTTAGIAEAAAHLPPGLTLVPGIELSCAHEGSSVHLLGYLFDPEDPELTAELQRIRDDRIVRARTMVERLQDQGIPVTWEQVSAFAGDVDGRDVVGRPHIARALVEVGAARDVQDAFDRWIGSGKPAHVTRYALDPVRAVRLLRAAGGVCVLAHPARGEGALTREVPEELAARMAEAGLNGIEADHPSHDDDERARWRQRAAELGVLVTGSSDDHGELTGRRLGCSTTDPDVYAALVAQASGASPLVG
ncbi:PHP domain-containing protein [Thermobifida cellulosilytica]|uniref:Phosphoesterase n=1 Tax=Thermobifida cellulosilytica TB100 TaxID=665004 RepID=A0A147KH79_THECS|nr:PHP domain-containing protein [Thermobifida cellulosilytica]KUP96646.1 phosphoesterase [Thermobifida cellulosilytica TB100]